MRASGSYRVLFNTHLWAEMKCERANQKSIRITAQDRDSIAVFLITVSPTCVWLCVCLFVYSVLDHVCVLFVVSMPPGGLCFQLFVLCCLCLLVFRLFVICCWYVLCLFAFHAFVFVCRHASLAYFAHIYTIILSLKSPSEVRCLLALPRFVRTQPAELHQ